MGRHPPRRARPALAESYRALPSLAQDLRRWAEQVGDRIKHLSWDGQGFCLYYKVLERGRFPWPKAELPADVIDASPAAGREREARRQLHHLA
ncbi:hypothetical protein D0Z66_05995 [Cereibacter sphaeroides]|nr:hypothetical protein D0Z66_05995 [Cereibacter sphaeroides]